MANFEHYLELWQIKFEKADPEKANPENPDYKAPDILPENYKLLKKHIRHVKNEGRKPRTIINHISILLRFSRWCKKPYVELTDDDFDDYWDTLKMKEVTKNLHKKLVKTFLKKINPAAAELKIRRIQNLVTPDQLLTDDEVYKLIDSTSNARDKALVACLYDSGARKGELLSTLRQNAHFDNYGCLLWLREGKTGPINARLIFASPYLRRWLDVHPRKNDPTAPIFCSFRKPRNVISQTGLYDAIKVIRQKACITKRTNPHIYRHTTATTLAKKLKSEQKIKGILGWKPDSTMTAHYITLSAIDVDDAVFEAEGIIKEDAEPQKPKVYRCKRCDTLNPVNEKICGKCGFLEDEPIVTMDEMQAQIAEISKQLITVQTMMLEKSPETIAVRREKMKRIMERSEQERSEN
jgi:integrase/recombinase XerD